VTLDCAVAVQEQYPHGPSIIVPVVVPIRPHGQVGHTVVVQVAQIRHGDAEVVLLIEDAGKIAFEVTDLLLGLDQTIAAFGNRDRVVFDLAVGGRTGRVRCRRIRAEAEAGIGRPGRAGGYRRERQGHDAAARSIRHSH